MGLAAPWPAHGMCDLPGPGFKLTSPTLTGRQGSPGLKVLIGTENSFSCPENRELVWAVLGGEWQSLRTS